MYYILCREVYLTECFTLSSNIVGLSLGKEFLLKIYSLKVLFNCTSFKYKSNSNLYISIFVFFSYRSSPMHHHFFCWLENEQLYSMSLREIENWSEWNACGALCHYCKNITVLFRQYNSTLPGRIA